MWLISQPHKLTSSSDPPLPPFTHSLTHSHLSLCWATSLHLAVPSFLLFHINGHSLYLLCVLCVLCVYIYIFKGICGVSFCFFNILSIFFSSNYLAPVWSSKSSPSTFPFLLILLLHLLLLHFALTLFLSFLIILTN